jgi:hypothetical protein
MEFKEEFLKKCHSSPDIEIHKVPESVKQALTFLRTLPSEFEEKYMLNSHYEKLFRLDKCAGQIVYWDEIDKRIVYLWKTMGFRGLALLESFVSCVNSENYYAAMLVLRTLLENSSLLHSYLVKIKPIYENWVKQDVMGKIIRKEISNIVVSRELEDSLIKYSHGTTLKDLIKNRPKWALGSVGKNIRETSKESGFEDLYDYYSLLCQFAHPSIGSNLIFYKTGRISDNMEVHDFSRNQNVVFFLKASAYPLNLSCKIIMEDVKELDEIRFMG